jgi:hypothetical protein
LSALSQEAHFTQNPALGAAIQWRFAVGYNEGHPTRGFAPLPLLFVAVPTILHAETAEQIGRTNKPSGLRAFAAKFSDSKVAKQDLLFSLHSRVEQWRALSLESLRMALATRLIHLNRDGTIAALSQTPARGSVQPSVAALLKEADKLGYWCGQLSLHEISNLLRTRF